jgi:hypothetical protein
LSPSVSALLSGHKKFETTGIERVVFLPIASVRMVFVGHGTVLLLAYLSGKLHGQLTHQPIR